MLKQNKKKMFTKQIHSVYIFGGKQPMDVLPLSLN